MILLTECRTTHLVSYAIVFAELVDAHFRCLLHLVHVICAICRLLQEATGDKEVLKKAIKDFEVMIIPYTLCTLNCCTLSIATNSSV
jgi:hypothetical protein